MSRILITSALPYINGHKDNVIVGRLIPAGTGGATHKIWHVARERDAKIIEARKAEAAEAAAALEVDEIEAHGEGDDAFGETSAPMDFNNVD